MLRSSRHVWPFLLLAACGDAPTGDDPTADLHDTGDGSAILFSGEASGSSLRTATYRIRPDGTDLMEEGRVPFADEIHASPDGRRVAFWFAASADEFPVFDFADGRAPVTLAERGDPPPFWAPNGAVFFRSLRGVLLGTDPVTGAREFVEIPLNATPRFLGFGPDGESVLFRPATERAGVQRLSRDGTVLPALLPAPWYAEAIRRSRNGWLAIVGVGADRPAADDHHLYVMGPQDATPRDVYAAAPTAFAWSPDGRRLALCTDGRLEVLDAVSGAVRVLVPASTLRCRSVGWVVE